MRFSAKAVAPAEAAPAKPVCIYFFFISGYFMFVNSSIFSSAILIILVIRNFRGGGHIVCVTK